MQVVNADNSVTLTPTLSISGDDGGWCSLTNNNYGYDTPALLLNGNKWQIEAWYYDAGDPIDFEYTFPNVTLPANGTPVDLSYAGKVQGACASMNDDELNPPFQIGAFYTPVALFTDGFTPSVSPGPCWILPGFLPACPSHWPSMWSGIPHPYLKLGPGQPESGAGRCGNSALWRIEHLSAKADTDVRPGNYDVPRCNGCIDPAEPEDYCDFSHIRRRQLPHARIGRLAIPVKPM